jgi:hypothetical protein
MEADMEEIQILLDVYSENKKEEAMLKFCVADYIIAKTSQYSDESALHTAWNQANEMRKLWTGEASSNSDTITNEQLIQYQIEKAKTNISFAQFIENNKLNQQES